MYAVILEIARRMGHMVEWHAPIQFESRAIPREHVPANAQPGTCQKIRLRRRNPRIPCLAEIHKLGKLQKRFTGGVTHQRKTRFDGGQKGVVADKRVLPITADTEPSADRNLLEWKQPIVRHLKTHLPQQLHACQFIESFQSLCLSQPGEKAAAG